MTLIGRYRKVAAGVYWIIAVAVYIVGLYTPNNEGGIPCVMVSLEWSIVLLVVMALFSSFPFLRPFLDLLATASGNFFMFPVLCGGINAAIIYGLRSLRFSKWKRASGDDGESSL